jgi:hypothetical protein
MYAISASADFPIRPLFDGGMEQSRIPGERDGDRPAILQAHAQRIVVEGHVSNAFIRCYRQNTHATPPTKLADFLARLILSRSALAR